ncbi:putative cation transporter, ankyrin repeat-containing domain, PGG domain-containing protein [Helianthus annuus]|nr:putative cation transporter, ankyrin repeat-containing domain, PGG domain-containing protein [Helianthus annuus]KAJ0588094.1 putative cation transporter, ankyrin repeat-containing domain, PGG domain-containing protein [Helianthus annuus]KAJ0596463.1 putative cation transporter, ankyrin repeat-containing domain, PGG domain-containing protein [Helianthus annuus]KAJ0757122.1 putative cation transporter, ankyrin repeat-containing domain, PGG domain-containing protein [Helianthus annuus]KAJ076084
MAMIGIVTEEFKEEYYDYWKTCLKSYLVGQDLWDVVTSEAEEKEKSQEWQRKNAQALHAIQLACGSQSYAKYKKKAHVTAKIAWDHLVEMRPIPQLCGVAHDRQDASDFKESHPYEDLYNAIQDGEIQHVNEILDKDPKATTARVSSHGDTALHIAILYGRTHIAQDLVNKMPPEGLEISNKFGATPLSLFAAMNENIELAKAMVEKNHNLVCITNGNTDQSSLPIIVASRYGRKQMVHYLYPETPKQLLNGPDGVMLLNYLITAGFFDIASKLLNLFPNLSIMADHDGDYAVHKLAHKPSAFASGSKFPFWKEWIYNRVCRYSPRDLDIKGTRGTNGSQHKIIAGTNVSQHEINISDEEVISQPSLLHRLCWILLQFFVPDIKNLHDRKLINHEANKLLILICKEIKGVSDSKLDMMEIDKAVMTAIKYGIVEFVNELLNYNPDFIWREDKRGRSIFSHAIVLRNEKIFSLFYRLGTKKSIVASRHDIFKNNFLHLAAKLSPPAHLEHISGPALQMQRELQWYKVERLVQPNYKDHLNESHRKPRTLFSEEHKDLANEGQKWMKNTAGSCMVVGTLIAAVMFTTAFTIPGGNDDDTGLPVMLNTNKTDRHSFLVFIISNGVALFTSSTSVLMFLGILTARYGEDDFLVSLPTKLIIGMACLFFSIVTMMISFGAAMFLMLHKTLPWVCMPLVLISTIPVVLFSALEFPLLIEMIIRTYGATIFDKHDKHDSIIKKIFQCVLLQYRGLSTTDISNEDPPQKGKSPLICP